MSLNMFDVFHCVYLIQINKSKFNVHGYFINKQNIILCLITCIKYEHIFRLKLAIMK
jgi:hypothetical protein